MTAQKVLGVLILLAAGAYLIIAIGDIAPEYASIPQIVGNAEALGLITSTTNLRFQIGLPMLVDALFIALLAIVGWSLMTTETRQDSFVYAGALVLVASIALRAAPLVPVQVARYSPGAFFYGARVSFTVVGDDTPNWVVIPPRPGLRVAAVAPAGRTDSATPAILDFALREALEASYVGSRPPIALEGVIAGTSYVARGRDLHALPRIRVVAPAANG